MSVGLPWPVLAPAWSPHCKVSNTDVWLTSRYERWDESHAFLHVIRKCRTTNGHSAQILIRPRLQDSRNISQAITLHLISLQVDYINSRISMHHHHSCHSPYYTKKRRISISARNNIYI